MTPALEPLPASHSAVTLAQMMLPSDANPAGNVHGGTLMKLADSAGGIAAMRHTRCRIVTVVMDSMTFETPVYVGDLVEVHAEVTWTGKTSLETAVTIEAESPVEGNRRRVSEAYFVYVALDSHARPTLVRPLAVEGDEARARWEEALLRRERRLTSVGRRTNGR